LPARRARASSRLRARGEAPARPALPRLRAVSRVFPRRRWIGRRRKPPDGLDRPRREAPPAERRMTMKPLAVSREACADYERASRLEWLETNGAGGFASGTVAGANTRRYHALLLTARKPPSERFVLVNQLEEWLDIDGQAIPLSTNLYPDAIHPAGYEHCIEFSTDPW